MYNCWPTIDKSKPGWGLVKPGLPIGTLLYLKSIYIPQGGWGLTLGLQVNHMLILQSDYQLKSEYGIWTGCHKYLVLATTKYPESQIKMPWRIYDPWIEQLYTVLLPDSLPI